MINNPDDRKYCTGRYFKSLHKLLVLNFNQNFQPGSADTYNTVELLEKKKLFLPGDLRRK